MMTGRAHNYRHGDYLQPSDNQPEIDLKQSPLVLLAQTCSAIGKDCGSSKMQQRTNKAASAPYSSGSNSAGLVSASSDVALKNLSDPVSRKDNNHIGSENKLYSTPSVSDVQSCKMSPRSDVPLDLKATNNVQKRSKSPLGGTSPPMKKLRTSISQQQTDEGKRVKSEIVSDLPQQHRRSEPITTTSSTVDKNLLPVNNRSRSTEENSNNSKHDTQRQKQQHQHQQQAITSIYNNGLPRTNGFVSATSTYSGALNSSAAPVMSIYDPFCVGCQAPHVTGASCLENLKNSQLGVGAAAAAAAANPLLSLQNPAAMTYYMQLMMQSAARRDITIPHTAPVTTAASTDVSGHICNWNSCGKIFATPDELMVHLKAHTNTSTPSTVAAVAAASTASAVASTAPYLMPGLDKLTGNPYAYFQQQALAAINPAAHNQLAGLMVRSTSPLSRYAVNPYKPPTNIFNPLANVPSMPVAAGVGPYCPPFGLYGQRFDNFSYH